MLNTVPLKEQLLEFCREYLKNKEQSLLEQQEELQESLTKETKSSAGDKYETGRAMLQLEREKLGFRLHELEKSKNTLSQVKIHTNKDRITVGSLFWTDKHCYFIAISAGKCKIQESTVFCISAQTPIALQALGKQLGQTFIINGVTHIVTKLE